ncbi:hypothetical protein ACLBXM_16050 [Xanthobacteraceae bacterium A53D]
MRKTTMPQSCNRRDVIALALGLSLGAVTLAHSPSAQAQQPKPTAVTTVMVPDVGPVNVLTYRAKVVSADPATRRVILEGASGKRWSVHAPLIAGDISQLRNSETLLISVVPGLVTALGKARQGKPGEVISDVGVDAGLPGWPEGFGVRNVTITTMLVNIDKANGTVSFEGADGLVRTVKSNNPQVLNDLANVNIGDLCQITYVEALVINAVR